MWGKDARNPHAARFEALSGHVQQPKKGTVQVQLKVGRLVLTGRFQTLPLTLHGFGLDQAAPRHAPASPQMLTLGEALQHRLEPGLEPTPTAVLETARGLQARAAALVSHLSALQDGIDAMTIKQAEVPVGVGPCLDEALALADDITGVLAAPADGQAVREALARGALVPSAPGCLDRGLCLALRWCRLLPGEEAGAPPATLDLAAGGLAALCALACLGVDAALCMLRRPAVFLILSEVLGSGPGAWPQRHAVHALAVALVLMEAGGVLACEALLGRWECPVPAQTGAGGIWPPDGAEEGNGSACEAGPGAVTPYTDQAATADVHDSEGSPWDERSAELRSVNDAAKPLTALAPPPLPARATIPQVDGASGYPSPPKRRHEPIRFCPESSGPTVSARLAHAAVVEARIDARWEAAQQDRDALWTSVASRLLTPQPRLLASLATQCLTLLGAADAAAALTRTAAKLAGRVAAEMGQARPDVDEGAPVTTDSTAFGEASAGLEARNELSRTLGLALRPFLSQLASSPATLGLLGSDPTSLAMLAGAGIDIAGGGHSRSDREPPALRSCVGQAVLAHAAVRRLVDWHQGPGEHGSAGTEGSVVALRTLSAVQPAAAALAMALSGEAAGAALAQAISARSPGAVELGLALTCASMLPRCGCSLDALLAAGEGVDHKGAERASGPETSAPGERQALPGPGSALLPELSVRLGVLVAVRDRGLPEVLRHAEAHLAGHGADGTDSQRNLVESAALSVVASSDVASPRTSLDRLMTEPPGWASLDQALRCLAVQCAPGSAPGGPSTTHMKHSRRALTEAGERVDVAGLLSAALGAATRALQACRDAAWEGGLGRAARDPGGWCAARCAALTLQEGAATAAAAVLPCLAGCELESPGLLCALLAAHAALATDEEGLGMLLPGATEERVEEGLHSATAAPGGQAKGRVRRARAGIVLALRTWLLNENAWTPRLMDTLFSEPGSQRGGLPLLQPWPEAGAADSGPEPAPQLPAWLFTTTCLLGDLCPEEWLPVGHSAPSAPPCQRTLRSRLAQALRAHARSLALLAEHGTASESRLLRAALGKLLARLSCLHPNLGEVALRPLARGLGGLAALAPGTAPGPLLHRARGLLELAVPLLHRPALRAAALDAGLVGRLATILGLAYYPGMPATLAPERAALGADAGALARRVMRCLAASEHGRAGLRNALVARHAASVAEAGAAGEHARTRLGLAAKWAADRAEGLLLDRGVLQELCETYDQDREWPMQPAHAKYAALEAALQAQPPHSDVLGWRPEDASGGFLVQDPFLVLFWNNVAARVVPASALSAQAAAQRLVKVDTRPMADTHSSETQSAFRASC
ncbi:hypothetical protein F751_4063 [Auxenochlorella protothecoides]|uniref:Uncharacterized protein n=1 Tax=Auxenochlorella protothecoides TaxID=3075 RepID=A0A087ST45_AUXPR|nr:hypothetical protein F751_4063 [Auxenochlorella protothecoides]KFM28899.1 hypothetical protein F751_4063 [Auxenochlorella protothecoides]